MVVLPFVPVMPTTVSSPLGCSKNASAAAAIALRAESTSSWGTSTSSRRSTMSATAPFATAWPAKSCPSAVNPGTHTCSAPGVAASAR